MAIKTNNYSKSGSYSKPSTTTKAKTSSKLNSTAKNSSSTSKSTVNPSQKRDTFTNSSAKVQKTSKTSNSTKTTVKSTSTVNNSSKTAVLSKSSVQSKSNRDTFTYSSQVVKQTAAKNIDFSNIKTKINSSVNNEKRDSSKSSTDSSTISCTLKGTGIGLNKNPLSHSKYKIDLSININHPQGATIFKINDTTLGRLKNGVPVGEPIFRIDNPHTNCNVKHFNVKDQIHKNNGIYQSLNHKPVSETVYKVAGNTGKISSAAKIGGKALGVFAIADDINSIYNSFKNDNYSIEKNTITTSSGVAGSWIGGAVGTDGGVVLGATIGSFICPGLGTAIGGAIGGFLGGIGGSVGGKTLGEEIAKMLIE